MLWSQYALRTVTGTMLWSPYALGTSCAFRIDVLATLCFSNVGIDALVTLCSRNKSAIMLWAWMLWSQNALGTRTESCFGHGCSGDCTLWQHERKLCFGHGCSGHRSRTWTALQAWMHSAANIAAYARRESKSALKPTAAYAPWTNFHECSYYPPRISQAFLECSKRHS